MTPAEALAAAFEERRAELRRYIEWCEANRPAWSDLTAEYRLRLDELDRLALSAQVGEMTEGEARAMAGDR